MKMSEVCYALRTLACELPAGMDDETADYTAARLFSRVRRAMRRRAVRIVRAAEQEETARRRILWQRQMDATTGRDYRAAVARRAAERAADRANLVQWSEQLARFADYDRRAAEREERAAGMAVARTRPAPGELSPVRVMRTADAAERAAVAARNVHTIAQQFVTSLA